VIHLVNNINIITIDSDFKETDTVISTIELIDLFSKFDFEFEKITEKQSIFYSIPKFLNSIQKYDIKSINDLNKLHEVYSTDLRDLQIFFEADEYFSSNGYGEFLIKQIIKELKENKNNSYNTDNFKIERKVLRNTDMREINLYYEDKIIIKFAIIYGFRNIQYILKNIKSKKDKFEYSYIEVMACPGGCLNGGKFNIHLYIYNNFKRWTNETN